MFRRSVVGKGLVWLWSELTEAMQLDVFAQAGPITRHRRQVDGHSGPLAETPSRPSQ